MKISPSSHFEERLRLRQIPENLAQIILREADVHYRDEATGLRVAVKRLIFQNKDRDMALSYIRREDEIILITLHPLKEGQKTNRVESGRWIPYEPASPL